MAFLNENYLKLQTSYLFTEIARRVREFLEGNPDAAKRLIRCGIGDVTEPLPRAAIEAMKAAAEELGHRETFRGYGPEQGYEFLRRKIAQFDYRDRESRSQMTKFSCRMGRNATAGTFSIFWASKIRSRLTIRCI